MSSIRHCDQAVLGSLRLAPQGFRDCPAPAPFRGVFFSTGSPRRWRSIGTDTLNPPRNVFRSRERWPIRKPLIILREMAAEWTKLASALDPPPPRIAPNRCLPDA